ncbi:hypothetical protein DO97_14005 [Neosynechococcus sphagnicola sy1]|uniref:Uncharacterized protein n=1 Tax=Neosynechococcus sphagnicola sy1 TaxID=1497020 RepID=A0A098TMD1_9CYAN|nr:hypothetical protein [Neosynechococcus sphagnicola]KGF71998.1 hypothetical protein DO97_14005 [Neosynechococcus sphagnicola sy1]
MTLLIRDDPLLAPPMTDLQKPSITRQLKQNFQLLVVSLVVILLVGNGVIWQLFEASEQNRQILVHVSKQNALGQQVIKAALSMHEEIEPLFRQAYLQELRQTLQEWEVGHADLKKRPPRYRLGR